jgi:iron complex transport system ATP-binding protein
MPTLSAEQLSLGYRRGALVVRDLVLTVAQGESVTLVGPNGSGKSTLLRTLARLMRPQHGAVYLDGRAIHRMSTRKVAQQLAILPRARLRRGPDGARSVARGRFARQAWWRASTAHDRDVIAWALEQTELVDLGARR